MDCSWLLLFLTSLPISFSFSYFSVLNPHLKCETNHDPVWPSNLFEIQLLILSSLERKLSLKPLGNLHSATDIICTEGIPVFMGKVNHFGYDEETQIVTVGAGLSVFELLEKLHQHGRTLQGFPAYGDVTVGGVIAVGSHGTSGRFFGTSKTSGSTTLADLIVSLVLVDGFGNVRNISGKELQPFKANLGLLGIMFEVKLRTIPQFKIKIEQAWESSEVLFRGNGSAVMKILQDLDYLQLFWFPGLDSVVLFKGTVVPVGVAGECEAHLIPEFSRSLATGAATVLEFIQNWGLYSGFYIFQLFNILGLLYNVVGRTPVFTEKNQIDTPCRKVVGFSHKMLSNRCEQCLWHHNGVGFPTAHFSISVPLENLYKALESIKTVLKKYPTTLPFGIHVRFISESDGLLMLNSERDAAVIEWALVARMDGANQEIMGLKASQAIFKTLVMNHQGRAHWAKNELVLNKNLVFPQPYPKIEEFIQNLQAYDPKSLFLNDFGKRLKDFNHTAVNRANIDEYICEDLFGLHKEQEDPVKYLSFAKIVKYLKEKLVQREGRPLALLYIPVVFLFTFYHMSEAVQRIKLVLSQ